MPDMTLREKVYKTICDYEDELLRCRPGEQDKVPLLSDRILALVDEEVRRLTKERDELNRALNAAHVYMETQQSREAEAMWIIKHSVANHPYPASIEYDQRRDAWLKEVGK